MSWRYELCRWTNGSVAVLDEEGRWFLLIPDWTEDEPERRALPDFLIPSLLKAGLLSRRPRLGWTLNKRGRRLRKHLRTRLNYRYVA